MSGSNTSGKSVGRLSRLGIGAQVALSALLALVAVLLVNWLAGRPGVRQRVDMTATSRNTLSTATLGVVERLEEPVRIDILYRAMEQPLTQLGAEVILRTEKLLVLLETAAGGKIDVEAVDTSDPEAWRERQQALRLRGYENGLVVSQGEQRRFIPLIGGLADFDLGVPVPDAYVPPTIRQFTAEESIVEAILDVTRGETLELYFTWGSGEPDALESDANEGLGLLTSALERDGFHVNRWNPAEDGPLPEDCAALVVIGPKRAWSEDTYDSVVDYVERGGRMVIAPATLVDGTDGGMRESDVPDLLEHFGMEVSEGRVATFVRSATGAPLFGDVRNELHAVTGDRMSTHPMLAPLRQAGGSFYVVYSHQIRVREQPKDGVAQHLYSSSVESWIDAAPGDAYYDPQVDGSIGEFPLAVATTRPPMQDVGQTAGLEAIPEIRIVALGTESAFANAFYGAPQYRVAELMLPMFNWVVDREHRVAVPPRDPDVRFLPLDPEHQRAWIQITRLAQFYLPGLALLAGVLVWFVRIRGSRRVSVQEGLARSADSAAPPESAA